MNVIWNDDFILFEDILAIIKSSRRVGFGTMNPLAKHHIVQEGPAGSNVMLESYNDLSLGSYYTFRRNKGTVANPLPVGVGTRLGEILFEGRLANGQYSSGASIAVLNKIIDEFALGADIEVYTHQKKRLAIKADGHVSIEDGVLKLSAKTTAERDALVAERGDILINADENKVQWYNGTSWVNLG